MADNDKKVEDLLQDIQRFQPQCFLRDHMKELNNLKVKTSGVLPYQNFVVLDGDPGKIIHQLVAKKDVDPLFEITPAQLSLLVPKIQIFKLFNENGKDVQRELVFKDHMSDKTIENMMHSKNEKGDDVGLKSFTFVLKGKYPGLDANTTECKLVLYFQNMASLIVNGPNGVSFKDLILFGKSKNEQGKSINYDIKAVVGWAAPQDPGGIIIGTDSKGKRLSEALKNSIVCMALKQNDYDLDFRENGSVEMSITYNGMMEGTMINDDSDIFYLTPSGQMAKTWKKKKQEEENKKLLSQDGKKQIEKKQPGTIDNIKHGVSSWFKETVNLYTQFAANKNAFDVKNITTKEEDEKALEIEKEGEIAIAEQVDKQEKYSRLLRRMKESSNMFYIDVDQQYLGGLDNDKMELLSNMKMNDKDLTDEERKTIAVAYASQKRRDMPKGNLSIRRIIEKNDTLYYGMQTVKQMTKLNVEQVDGQLPGSNYGKVNEYKQQSQESMNMYYKNFIESENQKVNANGTRRVNFFFFGDLLDQVLNVLYDEKRKDNRKSQVLLGSFIYYDPMSILQGNPRAEEVNLADVPISLELFTTWYLNKVVATQMESYKLGIFIKDVIADLLMPSIAENCLYNLPGLPKQSPNIGFQYLTVPANLNIQNGKRVNISELKEGTMNKQTFAQGSHKDIKDLNHYIYIYCTNVPLIGMKGDYSEDKKNGIYHLFVGGEKGLVKSIKFIKQRQEYVKEMRATADSEETKRMAGLFTVTVNMIGNTLFQLGQLFYIDTMRMSSVLGDPMKKEGSLARDLGIGGYYRVTKVDYALSKDDFETTIEAQRESEGGNVNFKVDQKNIDMAKQSLNKAEAGAKMFEGMVQVRNELNKKVNVISYNNGGNSFLGK